MLRCELVEVDTLLEMLPLERRGSRGFCGCEFRAIAAGHSLY